MYVHARRIGLSLTVFWSLTFREYSRECAAAALRARDDYNRDMTQAWHEIRLLAMAMHTGLPKLRTQLMLEPGDHERPPSMEEQRAAFEVISAQYNIPARPISKAAKDAMRRLREQYQVPAEALSDIRKN